MSEGGREGGREREGEAESSEWSVYTGNWMAEEGRERHSQRQWQWQWQAEAALRTYSRKAESGRFGAFGSLIRFAMVFCSAHTEIQRMRRADREGQAGRQREGQSDRLTEPKTERSAHLRRHVASVW